MTILALEFSSPQRSVAVVRGGARQAASLVREVIETGAGGTRAFAMIETALREAELERHQLKVLAIGLGPGSYTGIRIALAIAQGWQLAVPDGDVKLVGISSADCVAAQAQAEGIRGHVNVVVDAQRSELYLARYDISDDSWKEVNPLSIVPLGHVNLKAGAGEMLIGPEVTRWFPSGRIVCPRAATLGQLALRRDAPAAGDRLEPIYLRETQFVKSGIGRRPVH